jgi:signal peptidase II
MDKTRVRLSAYGLAAAVFALDRVTKIFIKGHFGALDTFTVIPGFFNIVHTENPGAAFSLFASAPEALRRLVLVALTAAALAVIAVLLWRMCAHVPLNRSLATGMALIFGGACGNLYDRAIHGTVTDFLELYYSSFSWPAFNVADSGITVGACLVVLDMLRSRHSRTT